MKKSLPRLPRSLIFLLAFLPAFLFVYSPAIAERLESNSYIIQFGNFNVTSGEKESASYNVTDTVGQTFAGPFGAYGSSTYFIGAGFQYIYQIDNFAFSISDVDIDLGTLTPGVHNSASNTLTITTKGAGGYTVYAYELHPLRHANGTTDLPDTTCDNGLCDESNATVWANQDIPGFGFNASGNDVPADFVNSTYFRQFADFEGTEAMEIVMTDNDIAHSEQATITYKAGVVGTQAAGDYQTGVVYIAVPGF